MRERTGNVLPMITNRITAVALTGAVFFGGLYVAARADAKPVQNTTVCKVNKVRTGVLTRAGITQPRAARLTIQHSYMRAGRVHLTRSRSWNNVKVLGDYRKRTNFVVTRGRIHPKDKIRVRVIVLTRNLKLQITVRHYNANKRQCRRTS